MDLSESENDNWCEVSVCVAASVHLVLDLTPPVNLVCEVGFPSVSVSDCEPVDPQTFSFSGKRCASVVLECEAKMNIEGPPVKAVPEAVRNRPTTQSALFKAVPEWVRSRAPPPPEGTPLQQTATWPSPPTDLPGEQEETEVEDANNPRNARERALIEKMESYLLESEELQVGIRELEFFFLGPGDEDISTTSVADNARDEGGYSRFVLFDTRRGQEVADAARFAEQAKKERTQRGRLEEELHRIAEPRTSQVSAHKVTDDTKEKILELEGAIAALRAERSIRAQRADTASQINTKGTEEQNQEASRN